MGQPEQSEAASRLSQTALFAGDIITLLCFYCCAINFEFLKAYIVIAMPTTVIAPEAAIGN